MCLVSEAHAQAVEQFQTRSSRESSEPLSLEEELFAYVAAGLRRLKPFRKYLTSILDTSLSPLTNDRAASDHAAGNHAGGDQADGTPALRAAHLETVSRIAFRHGQDEALSTVALHLYWTLYTGVLAFWSKDASPRQEDTLALLDQSLAMFAGWLTNNANPTTPHE